MKALLDYIPLIVFFYLYKTTDDAANMHIIVATKGLVIATLVVYGCLFIYQKFKLEKQQWFILAMTIVFGGLTWVLKDPKYIIFKAIIINGAFSLAFLLSPFFGKEKKPLVQRLFGPVYNLSVQGWKKLNLAWVGLFLFMACLHYFFGFLWQGGKYWGEFTAFGDISVMLTFIIGQIIILRQYLNLDPAANK